MRAADLAALALIAACSSSAPPAHAPSQGTPEARAVAAPALPSGQGDPAMNLDQLLQRASSSDFASYDPGAVIDAVNALVPLGKDRALDALDQFLARQDLAQDPHQGLFLVLRVAFDAHPHPPMLLGGSRPPPPSAPDALPRFPIALVDDVPLMLVSGYTLRGLAEPVTAHVTYYRAHGTLRTAPLAPAAGRDRMAGYEAQYHAAYHAAPSDAERELVRAQLARLKL
jgi:hypothetical protein